ncbi:MAG: lysophospholipase L1-like esterase [Pseudohongiellaceae bacterium]|jgi:lysophospholipase L1-like esterase
MSRSQRRLLALGLGFALLAGVTAGGNAIARSNGYGKGLAFDNLSVAADLGWRWLPEQHIESPHGYDIDINNYGLRDAENIDIEKPAGIYRVLCVGDSFTYGLEIPHEKTFSYLLEQALSERLGGQSVEVWNTGVNGYNSCQELAWLRDFGYELDPDLIIVGFVMNDAIPMVVKHPKQFPGRTWMLRYPLYQWLRHNYLYNWRLAGDDVEAEKLDKLIRQHRGHIETKPSKSKASQQFWDGTLACLGDLAEAAHVRDVPVMLTVFPTWPQMKKPVPQPEPQALLAAMAAEKGYRLVDLLDRYAAVGLDTLLKSDKAHPSVLGNKIAAAELLSSLESSGWLPGAPAHNATDNDDG